MSGYRHAVQLALDTAKAIDPRFPAVTDGLVTAWVDLLDRYGFSASQLSEGVREHYRQANRSLTPADLIKAVPSERAGRPDRERILGCSYCDDEGWVLDPGDRYGWAVRCRHELGQRIDVKPGHVPPGKAPDGARGWQARREGYWAGVRELAGTPRRSNPRYSPGDYRDVTGPQVGA